MNQRGRSVHSLSFFWSHQSSLAQERALTFLSKFSPVVLGCPVASSFCGFRRVDREATHFRPAPRTPIGVRERSMRDMW